MTRTLTAVLRGGPLDGETAELPYHLCRDRIALDGRSWIIEYPDGSATAGTGPRDPRATVWTRHVYAKGSRDDEGRLVYGHERTVEVRRCAATNASDGRRCRNEAEGDAGLCKTHARTRGA